MPVLCFGLVLTGETQHDHWVSQAATEGILRASLELGQAHPLWCVDLPHTLEQAQARALPPEPRWQAEQGPRSGLGGYGNLGRPRRSCPPARPNKQTPTSTRT